MAAEPVAEPAAGGSQSHRSSSWPTGNTRQADALTLVAQKLHSSLAVERELPEDGLAACGDDGDDLMPALARRIVADEEDIDPSESVFAHARQVAISPVHAYS